MIGWSNDVIVRTFFVDKLELNSLVESYKDFKIALTVFLPGLYTNRIGKSWKVRFVVFVGKPHQTRFFYYCEVGRRWGERLARCGCP